MATADIRLAAMDIDFVVHDYRLNRCHLHRRWIGLVPWKPKQVPAHIDSMEQIKNSPNRRKRILIRWAKAINLIQTPTYRTRLQLISEDLINYTK